MQKKLLLIEDDRDLRILIKEILEISFQVEVQVTNSSFDSLRLLKTGDFQMVISDYRIHQLGELSFLTHLQQNPYNEMPFIIYTGETKVHLKPSDKLKIVSKPNFQKLMDEVRCFEVFPDRNARTPSF